MGPDLVNEVAGAAHLVGPGVERTLGLLGAGQVVEPVAGLHHAPERGATLHREAKHQ